VDQPGPGSRRDAERNRQALLDAFVELLRRRCGGTLVPRRAAGGAASEKASLPGSRSTRSNSLARCAGNASAGRPHQSRLIEASQALLLWTGIALMANCVARM
jgi:hypothetical protein